MGTWHHAMAVFRGGTQEIKKITGKRTRTRQPLLGCRLRGTDPNSTATADLPAGAVGFIGHPAHDELLVAFPCNPKQQFASMDAMSRSGAFFVIYVNEPTFKSMFEIEQ
jgi:hypothetical protein